MRFVLASVTVALLALLECHARPLFETENNGSSNALSVHMPNVRAASTCADPSLAKVFPRAFAPSPVLHGIKLRWEFEHDDTISAQPWFVNIVPIFQAWATQQPFTVPLFGLGAASGLDFIYVVGADVNTPPVVAGFNNLEITGWVYNTPVCGSVPLLSAVYTAESDHFYTTSADEHDGLVSAGWKDNGIVAYVLPLTYD